MKKTALITGASSGIGEAYATVFAKNGYNLILTARNQDKLHTIADSLKQQYGIDAFVIAGDLSQYNFANTLTETCKNRNIEVDILVNNAGFADFGEFYTADWDKNREMIDLNIMALTHLTRLFLPDMVQRKSGKILNIASTAAFLPGPLMSVYYASKAYVLSFSVALADELKGTGVSVTVQCPGPVQTNFQQKAEMQKSKLLKNNPSVRLTPMVVAEFGYKELMKGKAIAIQGAMNKMTTFIPRLLPRTIVAAIVRKAQEPVN